VLWKFSSDKGEQVHNERLTFVIMAGGHSIHGGESCDVAYLEKNIDDEEDGSY